MPNEILLNLKQIEHLKQKEDLGNDEIILRILSQIDIPIPFNFIREISGLPKGQVHRILTTLERFGYIQKATVQRATFYKIKKSEENGK